MRRKGARTGPGRTTRAQVVVARRWLLGETRRSSGASMRVGVRHVGNRSRRACCRRAGARAGVLEQGRNPCSPSLSPRAAALGTWRAGWRPFEPAVNTIRHRSCASRGILRHPSANRGIPPRRVDSSDSQANVSIFANFTLDKTAHSLR